MKKAIPHRKENEQSVASKLCNLFTEIDIDGDKEMTWDEFTNFIIKSGLETTEHSNSVKKYQQIIPKSEINFNSLQR
jgi:hypothetical protein